MKNEIITIGINLLFILTCIIPSTAQISEQSSQLTSQGNWLYVGGPGPGNYSKIQDAIDNASDGDTVFVYDDSSPYIENIVINTSISLLGEEKTTTVINGSTNNSSENMTDYFGIWITVDNVIVRGFTIQSCNLSGIYLSSNHTNISDTIISNNDNYGIVMGSGDINQPNECAYNTIANNLVLNNMMGIFVSGQNNIVKGNVISQNILGIAMMFSMNSNISYNIISRATTGIYITGSYNTVIYRNNISDNDKGIYMMMTSADRILQNNFIDNNESASAAQMLFIQFYYKFKGEISYPIRRNIWNENYWDRPRTLPYKSPGVLWFFIDWHPAQEPYDIPDLR